MKKVLIPKPLNCLEKTADFLMTPLMYLISGTFREKPQLTHRWNNHRFKQEEITLLDKNLTLKESKIESYIERGWFRFHVPIFGGWKKYVVIKPKKDCKWYPGWIVNNSAGVSRLIQEGPVRLLRGDSDFEFFGLKEDGSQIEIEKIGEGEIGDNSEFYKKLPLL